MSVLNDDSPIGAIPSKVNSNNTQFDFTDLVLLQELANGASVAELVTLLCISKRNILYRKKVLKERFQLEDSSIRDLVLKAKQLKLIA